MSVVIQSGLGGFAAIASQTTYGGTYATPTKTLVFKSGKATWNPHPVQGGPYLAGGRFVDIGSARVLTWLDAKGTLTGDVTDTSFALLLACALGTSATMAQIGTTTAYELGGTNGANLNIPDVQNTVGSGAQFDMQWGIPVLNGTSGATLNPVNFHSCVITKAEFMFPRDGLVTYSFDFDAQYVETSTALISPSYNNAAQPFTMNNASSAFSVGTYQSETAVDGVRKATITWERKVDDSRIYLGSTYKQFPTANDLTKVTVALDTDYTLQAETLYSQFLAGTAQSIIVSAIGNAIGSSGHNRTFGFQIPYSFVDTGGERDLDGPKVISNTLNLSSTIDTANDPTLIASYVSPDTAF